MSERPRRGKKEKESTEETPTPATPAAAATKEEDKVIPDAAIDEALLSPNAATAAGPAPRDIILGEQDEGSLSEGHRATLLLKDLISLHILLWKASGKAMPKTPQGVDALTERLFQLTKKGKGRDLAGLKDVPRPFLIGTGRFLKEEDGEWKELSDGEARPLLKDLIFKSFKAADNKSSSEDSEAFKTLKEELKEYVTSQGKASETSLDQDSIKPSDVILLQRTEAGDGDKAFDNQGGNKAMFTLASQYVNSEASSPSKRLEAALSVFLTKGSTTTSSTTDKTEDEKTPEEPDKPRFVFCKTSSTGQREFSLVKPVDAAEVTLLFVFEVWLEKELAGKRDASAASAADSAGGPSDVLVPPGTEPIDAPTPHDVLFGRGGMTNSHQGNKRFRDVIALHRPDYIKAIKNDKPSVARKIVRAIRTSTPPGRFLKKSDEAGKWLDVGDKVAAEKASQALREKSNDEKRRRSAQREAQKGKGDGETAAPKAKKAKTADTPPTLTSPLLTSPLNYVGATIASTAAALKGTKGEGDDELKTEGLPPNAVDKDGNILVTDFDILCGRGGLTNHHRGNKRFRDIVALHRPDYIRAPKVQKPSVARVIVRAIRNGDPPGRFLKKDEKTGQWVDVGDKKAAEKTSQALREKGPEKGEPGASPTAAAAAAAGSSPAFLLPTPSVPPLGTAEAATVVKGEEKDGEKTEGVKTEEKDGEAKEEEKEGAKPVAETVTV